MPSKRDILIKLMLGDKYNRIFTNGLARPGTRYQEFGLHLPLLPWPCGGKEVVSFTNFQCIKEVEELKKMTLGHHHGHTDINNIIALTWSCDAVYGSNNTKNLDYDLATYQKITKNRNLDYIVGKAISCFLAALSGPGVARNRIPAVLRSNDRALGEDFSDGSWSVRCID
jgi:hypothetical protein